MFKLHIHINIYYCALGEYWVGMFYMPEACPYYMVHCDAHCDLQYGVHRWRGGDWRLAVLFRSARGNEKAEQCFGCSVPMTETEHHCVIQPICNKHQARGRWGSRACISGIMDAGPMRECGQKKAGCSDSGDRGNQLRLSSE